MFCDYYMLLLVFGLVDGVVVGFGLGLFVG